MAKPEEFDLAYRLLDLDLVDSEGTRCGKVDDIELSGGPGEVAYLDALISGAGAYPARFNRRLRPLLARLLRNAGATRISWSTVDQFEAAVSLTRTAAQLGLGEGDRRLARLLPGEESE